MRRVLKGLGWTLLGLLLLLVMGAAFLLGTSAGSRWALEQVPGLQVEGFEGRLGGAWQAERLIWEQADRRVEVGAPRLDWSPSCLLRGALCVNELTTGDIDLDFPPGEEAPSDEPFDLPELNLPLELEVGQVDIGRLRLNKIEQLENVQLSADWRADGLDIHALRIRRKGLSAALSGRLLPSGDWPLQLTGQAQVEAVDEQAANLRIEVEGQLREEVKLAVVSEGYLNGELAGSLRPLDESLPARLRLTADGFKASPDLPDTLTLNDLALTAEGNLDEGYVLDGNARFPGEGGAVQLALQGLVDAGSARIDRLELSTDEQRRLRLDGRVDWKDGLQAEANLHWQDFPWQRLYPMEAEPPVALRELAASVHYEDGRYLGHFDADMTGPAGDFSLASPVSGDLESVHLPELKLVAGQGRASGELSVGFANGIDWDTRLELSELDPSYWVAELPGNLRGSLNSSGALRDEGLQAEADLQLTGRLRDLPTELRLQAAGQDDHWNLPVLDLRLGDNRIQGGGRWAETLDGQLRLDLPRLAQLWPELQGEASGRLELAGTAEAPQGRLALEGQGLAFGEQQARSLSLEASLAEGERGRLSLNAAGLEAGETDLGELEVTAEGIRDSHQASLQLQGPTVDLALALEGGLQNQDWRGRLLRAAIDGGGQSWALREPAAIERLADGRLTVGAHCWVSGPASLCGDEQRLQPEPQIRYRLRDFPLDSLAYLLPENFAWQGELSADLALALMEQGPSGEIHVDAGGGVLRVRDEDEWVDFPYEVLRLDSQLTPRQVDSRFSFQAGALGELEMQARIDPQGETKPLDGTFRISGLNLGVARPFVEQLDRLEGQLNGSGTLSGNLTQPQVEGQLVLSGGQIAGDALPTTIEDLQVRVDIEGERLRIDGDWRSGEQGRGQLEGSLAWADALVMDLRVDGQRLPVVVEPYAELEVAPSLRISLEDERLAVSGRVEVPRGQVVVRELPPSTVQVSGDAVIIGEREEEAPSPLALSLDIDVEVGQDRLSFSGFGLTADLAGYLHIGDDLDARGELELRNGRYRAYGQRLTLRRARLLFTGPVSQPFLDIEAIRRIEEDDVVVGLRITGSTEQPRIDVFSEPDMSQEQALAYLVLGRPLGADTGETSLVAQAALGLGLAGGSRITGGIAQRLGIQDFQLDTQGSGDSTTVVASGQLTDRLSLRYGVGVFEPGSTIGLRYRLTRRLFLEVASGVANSLDLFYRRDF